MKLSILITLLEKASLIVVLFLLISKFRVFKEIFEKDKFEWKDLLIISFIFTFLAILGTYNGISYMGSLVNTRIIAIVSGGILFGPVVSIPAGILSGIHRYLIDIGGVTAVPCFLGSVSAGVLSGFLHSKIPENKRGIYGILVGAISESFCMLLIYIMSTPHNLAIEIIKVIYMPLISGQIGVGFLVSIVQGIWKDKKDIEDKNKSEIKALQRQINPHFLFNSLNTISSFIRFAPDKARDLIISLSVYLRHNLEFSDNLIDIEKEINQVKSYVEIENARFGESLKVVYDIDNVDIKVPSLIIQPLVENAIKHGILEGKGKGEVKISVKAIDNKVKISVQDDGVGINEKIIKDVYNDNMPDNKIGLYNVHLRLKLVYGKGLYMKKLDNGTLIEFDVRGINHESNYSRR